MILKSKIVLGTVQLGLDYGIANKSGKPSLAKAKEIIKTALDNKITFFDTAQSYGNSEAILGECLNELDCKSNPKIISKHNSKIKCENTKDAVLESIKKLKIKNLWGYMLHNEELIENWQNNFGKILLPLKQKGLIKHLGVSVYSPSYAIRALENPDISIIQVPANIFDRRMERADIFTKAKNLNKTVFVRSIYLQGLIMLEKAPDNISYGNDALMKYTDFCITNNLDKIKFAMAYAEHKTLNSYLVVGAETATQVQDNCNIYNDIKQSPIPEKLFTDWDNIWPEDIEDLVCPTNWSNKK